MRFSLTTTLKNNILIPRAILHMLWPILQMLRISRVSIMPFSPPVLISKRVFFINLKTLFFLLHNHFLYYILIPFFFSLLHSTYHFIYIIPFFFFSKQVLSTRLAWIISILFIIIKKNLFY